MNLPNAISEAEAEKLLHLMTETDGGQPFVTHKAAAAMGAYILAELGKIAASAPRAGGERTPPLGGEAT